MRSEAPAASLIREGEVWRLRWGARELVVKNSLGLGYLDRLIRRAGQPISAAELAGAPQSGGEEDVLDRQAVAAYRRRIADLHRTIEESDRNDEQERMAKARTELQLLTAELKRAAGLGGRPRRFGSDAEKARVNVTRAIHAAIDRIAAQDADLATSLRRSVQTGNQCVYLPPQATASSAGPGEGQPVAAARPSAQ